MKAKEITAVALITRIERLKTLSSRLQRRSDRLKAFWRYTGQFVVTCGIVYCLFTMYNFYVLGD